MRINNVGIIGIGSYVPYSILTNEAIDLWNIGTNAEWTKNKLGIEKRHIAYDEETSDLAYHASLEAIKDAKIDKNDIDLIILSTSSADRISPATSAIMMDRLGIKKPNFDINVVCCGFIFGLQLATNLIATKQYKNILLVASEKYSKISDRSKRDCIFFGDGSGAVIVSEVKGSWVSTDIYGDGSGKNIFTCHHGGKFQMDGKAVYEFGIKELPKSILESLVKNNLTVDDISWLIPHQPSINILKKTAELINLPIEKVVINMTNYGNTASSSIPMALDSLYKMKKLMNDDILVMPALGSGMCWGTSIMKYIKNN
jgi:3-oxoacyl-[acyl-carrier-protein] synthase III